jgi:cytochrome c553
MKLFSNHAISFAALFAAATSLHAQDTLTSAVHPGKIIWEKHCVECHGQNGEGVKGEYSDPLHGDRTVASLSKRIDKTMPEEDPDLLNAEESAQVAEYIYNAFYSEESRAKSALPIRHSFSRLTVPQFRNSVADLFSNPQAVWSSERGLSARYSSGKDKKKEDFQRKDNQVRFDFGEASPQAEVLPADNFSIKWEGSIIAEENGVYIFVIRTQNGARLSVNNWREPIIDAWVSSGPDVREEKGSIFLLGGRAYPISLEHFKFKEKSSSIELLWKAPNGVLETIPQRNLFPYSVNESLVISTPFPADDSSDGYPRGTSISKAWFEAVTNASIAAAESITERIESFLMTEKDDPERANELKARLRQIATTAFRRKISNEEHHRLIESRFAATPDNLDLAIKRTIIAILTSPQFLYPDVLESEKPDQFAIASRLALALWDSVPDRDLANHAANGWLNSEENIRKQANRMLRDPRTKEKLHGFFHHWLEMKDIHNIAKDPKKYPDLNEAVLADLRRSLSFFIDDIVWNGSSDYRQLLSADYMVLNDRLAKFYQTEPVGPDFKKVHLEGSQRAGLITHPYLLTSFAYFKDTSPIHRGVFLTRSIVGRALNPPPEAVEFKDAHFDPTWTMREKVTDVTRSAACMGCHSEINPLGFALEQYDAVGRWRESDNNKPINTASEYPDDNGGTVRIATPKDIANFAIGSETSNKTFVKQLFHHTNKQPLAAYGKDTEQKLVQKFAKADYSIQQLLLESALLHATHGTEFSTPKETTSK